MRRSLFVFVVAVLLSRAVAADIVSVSPNQLGPWQFGPNLSACGFGISGTVNFVSGPGSPPLGTGSLQIDIPSDSPTAIFFGKALDGVPLTSLTELRYSTFVTFSSPSIVTPRLVLSIEPAFDQIEFQPRLQGVPVTPGVWQSWDALAGGWRSLFGPANAPLVTLAAYAAAHPGAHIATLPGMALVSGCDGSRMRANVDAFTIGVNGVQTIFDFELTPPAIPAFDPWVIVLLAVVLAILGMLKLS